MHQNLQLLLPTRKTIRHRSLEVVHKSSSMNQKVRKRIKTTLQPMKHKLKRRAQMLVLQMRLCSMAFRRQEMQSLKLLLLDQAPNDSEPTRCTTWAVHRSSGARISTLCKM